MGSSSSKNDGNKALLLCKERMRFIKQAVDLRYALSAAQLSYTQSLRNVGAALRQFAEAEISVSSPQSIFESEQALLPHSSYASPSPSRGLELHDGVPVSPCMSNVSYMRARGSASVRVTVGSSSKHYVEEEGEEALTFPVPPHPPFPEIGSSWDFFDPVDAVDSIKIPNGEHAMRQHFGKFAGLRRNGSSIEDTQDNFHSLGIDDGLAYKASLHEKSDGYKMGYSTSMDNYSLERSSESTQTKACNNRTVSSELCRSKIEKAEPDKRRETEREDTLKLITHEAKDFLSSIKDIDYSFIRASESGHEVSRMLETQKIRLNIHSEIRGKSSDSFQSVLLLSCCKAGNLSERDTIQHATKIITWKRSVSSRSSSSRNPLTSTPKDDGAESGNDFVEEFSMISGSHSSTLDRLYAWERKLYDELKSSESIRKAYDEKCNELRQHFAKDMNRRVMEKTRCVVKDLHSRVRVTIQKIDSISRRIEKLRDEELQPQLGELIQGLMRMWNAMFECHNEAQQRTISTEAYNSKKTCQNTEKKKKAAMNLVKEMEMFRYSFITWIETEKSYSESLNGWLQKCILHPEERLRGRKLPFCPRRAVAPPIFVLCRDWLGGIEERLFQQVSDSINELMLILVSELEVDERLIGLQASFTVFFKSLVQFSEESVNLYQVVNRENQTARDAYLNS